MATGTMIWPSWAQVIGGGGGAPKDSGTVRALSSSAERKAGASRWKVPRLTGHSIDEEPDRRAGVAGFRGRGGWSPHGLPILSCDLGIRRIAHEGG
jgi:hypothetical protein